MKKGKVHKSERVYLQKASQREKAFCKYAKR